MAVHARRTSSWRSSGSGRDTLTLIPTSVKPGPDAVGQADEPTLGAPILSEARDALATDYQNRHWTSKKPEQRQTAQKRQASPASPPEYHEVVLSAA
jgi:hypothetical protein